MKRGGDFNGKLLLFRCGRWAGDLRGGGARLPRTPVIGLVPGGAEAYSGTIYQKAKWRGIVGSRDVR